MLPRLLHRSTLLSHHCLLTAPRIHVNSVNTQSSRSFTVHDAPRKPQRHQWQSSSSLSRQNAVQRRIATSAPSITPVTTVNAKKNIPREYDGLYKSLVELKRAVAEHVSVGRVELAVRGLEGRKGEAVVRVAVLGVRSAAANTGTDPDIGKTLALRLVQNLLADPLLPEAAWEKSLEKDVGQDGRGLLIRYGEEYHHDIQQPQLRIISIPSRTLLEHNLELIVYMTSYEQNTSSGNDGEQLLLPTLSIPISASGRETEISYPVHKTIIVGGGIEGLMACSRLQDGKMSNQDISLTNLNQRMILKVVDGSWDFNAESQVSSNPKSVSAVNLINLAQTETAIAHFRKSIEDISSFTKYQYNIDPISSWLTSGTSSTTPLKPSIADLINHVLLTSASKIDLQRLELQNTAISPITSTTRTDLSTALTSWSQNAHTDLQLSLEEAFSARSWRRLTWWKLPWRVDDVEMITVDILQRSWLVEAEKDLLWLVGRLTQAGLIEDKSYVPGSPPPSSVSPEALEGFKKAAKYGTGGVRSYLTHPPPPTIGEMLDPDSPPVSVLTLPPPNIIAAARSTLLSTTVPSLTATAQSLLLYSLSTITLTSTFSLLTYVSISTQGLYETGGIASLGLVWALRRLQSRWEKARREWVEALKEEGRVVLQGVEGRLERVVREGPTGGGETEGDGGLREEESRALGEAANVVRAVEAELQKVVERENGEKDEK
ncbi:MAG: hypothetical protein MMC33_007466 [Icmadophila ericetorum]|nr:hypothetical protein [Icmadophila ericetorum]